MSRDVDSGWTAADTPESGAFRRETFSHSTGKLRLDRRGPVRESIREAYDRGARGSGCRVVVIDSGFQDIGTLGSIHSESEILDGSTGHHGTIVAHLVREAAPEAELVLLEVPSRPADGIPRGRVAAALRKATAIGCDVVNLSLEFSSKARPRDPAALGDAPEPLLAPGTEAFLAYVERWIDFAEPYADDRCPGWCQICDSVGTVPPSTVVVAAAGNKGGPTCPACNVHAVGVGFAKTEYVEIDGNVYLVSTPPDTLGSLVLPEFQVEEPPRFRGTSFAAPLLAGAFALVVDRSDLERLAGFGRAMTPLPRLMGTHRRYFEAGLWPDSKRSRRLLIDSSGSCRTPPSLVVRRRGASVYDLRPAGRQSVRRAHHVRSSDRFARRSGLRTPDGHGGAASRDLSGQPRADRLATGRPRI